MKYKVLSMIQNTQQLAAVRTRILLFMIALALSGITVWPVEIQLRVALSILPPDTIIAAYLQEVLLGYNEVSTTKPYLLYGFDWLGFAHLVLAVLFIGPYRNPVRNIWVIEFGLIACLLVFPFAFIAGGVRGIPVWWRFIDCSFGFFGFLLLWNCRNRILKLERARRIQVSQARYAEAEAWEANAI